MCVIIIIILAFLYSTFSSFRMFVIISFPILFDLYEEFKKLGGGNFIPP